MEYSPLITFGFLDPPKESITGYSRERRGEVAYPPTFLDAMAVREKVFVDEQHVAAENELDADDARSWHWVSYLERPTSKAPTATVRLVPPPHPPHPTPGSEHRVEHVEAMALENKATRHHDGREPYVKLGRLAVAKESRGLGQGRMVVQRALDWAARHADAILPPAGGRQQWQGLVMVHAQKVVEPMWRKMGFETDEELGNWIEEDIEHVGMWRRIALKS